MTKAAWLSVPPSFSFHRLWDASHVSNSQITSLNGIAVSCHTLILWNVKDNQSEYHGELENCNNILTTNSFKRIVLKGFTVILTKKSGIFKYVLRTKLDSNYKKLEIYIPRNSIFMKSENSTKCHLFRLILNLKSKTRKGCLFSIQIRFKFHQNN